MRMTSAIGPVVGAAALLLIASGCARRTPSNVAPMSNRDVLTTKDFEGHGFHSVLDAVQALRGNWLEAHGSDSFYTPSSIQVYLDANHVGGIDVLSAMPLETVVYIRHYDGVTATARWGVGHSQGVIYVSTHPAQGPI